ncbi:MAG: triosephosphate isomerase, partial [Acidimicrobiia bacterium]|nr:triosephosphate isomerase [Acidimicrobiia bacterium]
MARKDLIAGNWKMNATHLEAIQMVQKLSYRLEPDDYERVDVVVCPPFTALRSVQTVIESDHLPIRLGAQDVHWQESGAYTGAISPGMLRSLGVRFVIVGHSERRSMFGDDDSAVARKLAAVLAAGTRRVAQAIAG